jgi:hypothetical protein
MGFEDNFSHPLRWVGFAFINSKQVTHGTQSMGLLFSFTLNHREWMLAVFQRQ